MASAHGFALLAELSLVNPSLTSHGKRRFPSPSSYKQLSLKLFHGVSAKSSRFHDSAFVLLKSNAIRGFRISKSVELENFLTSDDEEEMGEGFFEAIEELERMMREPSDILEEMNGRLSARELQLVLVYFSQDGKDSWCALEVFDWLRKEKRVDKETMELMVALMCIWVKKLIQDKHHVSDVVDLLVDMDCVGLRPSFSMIEKVISLYWEIGEKEKAIMFVEEVLRRDTVYTEDDPGGHKGGPTGYLAWKMMVSNC